jgi:hypothetical protein
VLQKISKRCDVEFVHINSIGDDAGREVERGQGSSCSIAFSLSLARFLSLARSLARSRARALSLSLCPGHHRIQGQGGVRVDPRPTLTLAHTCRRRQLALGGDYAYRGYHGPGSYLQKTANMTWALLWLVVIVSILCCPPAAAATATAAAAASAAARAPVSNCIIVLLLLLLLLLLPSAVHVLFRGRLLRDGRGRGVPATPAKF